MLTAACQRWRAPASEAALDRLSGYSGLGYPKTATVARLALASRDPREIEIALARIAGHLVSLERAEREYRAHPEIVECAACMADLDALRAVRAALQGPRAGEASP